MEVLSEIKLAEALWTDEPSAQSQKMSYKIIKTQNFLYKTGKRLTKRN